MRTSEALMISGFIVMFTGIFNLDIRTIAFVFLALSISTFLITFLRSSKSEPSNTIKVPMEVKFKKKNGKTVTLKAKRITPSKSKEQVK